MESKTKNKNKKRSPLSKRQLSSKVTAGNLWVPDLELFQEIARKRHKSDAELLRDIVHQWAVTTRLAPDTEEGAQEVALIDLQKETKKKVEELGEQMLSLLKQLVQSASTHGDLLSLNEAQMSHLSSVSGAHFNVSAQSFAALWSLVEMFQRFYVEKALPQDTDTHQAAIAIRDDIRGEGLRMIEAFTNVCESPLPVKMILIYPSGSEPT